MSLPKAKPLNLKNVIKHSIHPIFFPQPQCYKNLRIFKIRTKKKSCFGAKQFNQISSGFWLPVVWQPPSVVTWPGWHQTHTHLLAHENEYKPEIQTDAQKLQLIWAITWSLVSCFLFSFYVQLSFLPKSHLRIFCPVISLRRPYYSFSAVWPMDALLRGGAKCIWILFFLSCFLLEHTAITATIWSPAASAVALAAGLLQRFCLQTCDSCVFCCRSGFVPSLLV